MKITRKNIILYILSAILVIFYVCVLWWGQHPDVGLEYRMYYITHELSDWCGYGNLSYTPGTVEYCTELKDRNGTPVSYRVCQRKGTGWESEQYEGSISSGDTSYLYYVSDTDIEAAKYEFEISGFSGTGKVIVYCNDTAVGMFDNEGTFSFDVGQIEKEQLVTIRFVSQDCTFTLWSTQLK
jgi:hypothetical protein